VKITISKENYLKAIAEAESEGETVIAATLTRWLGVSAPAVTMAIRRLKRDALIRVGKEGQITLTSDGHEIANRLLLQIALPIDADRAGRMPLVVRRRVDIDLEDADFGIVRVLREPIGLDKRFGMRVLSHSVTSTDFGLASSGRASAAASAA